MIHIASEVTLELTNNIPGLYELAGLPDCGSTSAAFAMLVEHQNGAETITLDTICVSSQNTPETEYLRSLIPVENQGALLLAFYDKDNPAEIFRLIDALANPGCIIVIDDFYSALLYRSYLFIKDFAKGLKACAVRNGIKIVFISQYRYVINNVQYQFAAEEDMKSLYWEHLSPFVTGRISVVKDANSDIHVMLRSVNRKKKGALAAFLDSMKN